MASPSALAEQALLLEVAATPTPGNVDRERDLDDLRFDQLLAGASGARPGLERLANGLEIGAGLETAVRGMVDAAGTNTQFGALLLLSPLVKTAAEGDLIREAADLTTTKTTVDDAVAFYSSFDHVNVAVDEPPEGLEPLDVRRGSEAEDVIRERDLTLRDVLEASADHDAIAREWTGGFTRTFGVAEQLAASSEPLRERAARAHLQLLGEEPDTLVATKHGEDVAKDVQKRASELDPDDGEAVERFAEGLVERGINPGTTADLLAGGLYVALQREEIEP